MRLYKSLVLAILCVVVWASYAETSPALSGEPALLSGLGIITGHDGGDLQLDQPLTRAEFAVLAVRMRGMEVVARSARGFARFSDVSPDHWAVGHIGIAVDHGMIAPVSRELFSPSDSLSWDEFLGGLLVTCGYDERPPVDPYPQAHGIGIVPRLVSGIPTVSRGDAFEVLARALIAPTGPLVNGAAANAPPLIEMLGARPLSGHVIAHRPGGTWDEAYLEAAGERFTLRVSPAVDLSGRMGTDIVAWVSDGVIIAAEPADSALVAGRLTRTVSGREFQLELSGGQMLGVSEDTRAIVDGNVTTSAELANLPLNSLVRASIADDHILGLWAHSPGTELVVVAMLPSGIRTINERGTIRLLSRYTTIRLLGGDLWRGPLRPGTVLYELPGGKGYTAWIDRRTGVVTGFDLEPSGILELDSGPLPVGPSVLSGPGGWWFAELTQLTASDLLGREVQVSIDLDGRVRYIEADLAPASGRAFVDTVTGETVRLVNASGLGFVVVPAAGAAVSRGGLVEFNPLPDGTTVVRPVMNSVTDSYFPAQHIDPDRMMIRGHDGVWRRLTADTAVFYDEEAVVFPFHPGGVTAFGANMIRHFGFHDPAAGAVATAVLGPGPGGPVVETLTLRTPFLPARWHSPAMIGVIVAVNSRSDAREAIILIEQSYMRVAIGDAAIRARTSTHGGQASDRLSDLSSGEVVRLQFNPVTGEIISVTELRARPYTTDQPVFSVVSHDESIDSLVLVSSTGERMELLVSSATVIYDSRGRPRPITAAQTVGCSVQIITEAQPGLAGILVVVGP